METQTKAALVIIGIVLFLWSMVATFPKIPNTNNIVTDGGMLTDTYRPNPTTAWIMAQKFMKQVLKSPSTADFVFQPGSKACTYVSNSRCYACIGEVDSQNSYGATVRTKLGAAICENKDSKSWSLLLPVSAVKNKEDETYIYGLVEMFSEKIK